MGGKVFLYCDRERGEFLQGVLGESHSLEVFLTDGGTKPAPGDVVLADCVGMGTEWRGFVSELRRGMAEGTRLMAVLRYDQMRSLDAGAPIDDFVVDNGTAEEIRARVRRMAGGDEAGRDSEGSGGLEIDLDRYEVRVAGKRVELTFKEFELLHFLASRPGKVFTREMLLEQVWGYDYFGGSRTVDVHIRRIRAKIEREGRTYIRTVRGVGYIFEAEASER